MLRPPVAIAGNSCWDEVADSKPKFLLRCSLSGCETAPMEDALPWNPCRQGRRARQAPRRAAIHFVLPRWCVAFLQACFSCRLLTESNAIRGGKRSSGENGE